MPAPKTQPTDADVDASPAAIEDAVTREDSYGDLLERLGRHRTGRSFLYVKRLQDVDTEVLREMAGRSYQHSAARRSG